MNKIILIIEKNEATTSKFQKIITSNISAKILVASNTKEAIKHILNENFIHIVLLDLLFSKQEQDIVTHHIKEKDIPIIVLAEQYSNELKNIMLEKDIIGYILKNNEDLKDDIKFINRILKNYSTNILIAEDSKLQLRLAVNLLERMRLNVTTATNGKEALDIITKNDKKYSLVLTDYNMPVMDGLELTFALRQNFKKDQLAIIVLSSSTTPNIATNFLRIGANDFINKPYSEIEFRTRINSNLELLTLFEQNKDQEQELYEQKKNNQLSEMIGNIAHHWRQPLSAISTATSGLQIGYALNNLNKEDFDKFATTIVNGTQFLSKTIDSFAKFINAQKDKKIKDTLIVESIDNAIHILDGVLRDNNINLKKEINIDKELKMSMIEGELSKVIIDLITNAKDILVSRNIENKEIIVGSYSNLGKIIITIEDNAGGIPEDILPKIFDPYFTTKHQSRGTGLGLYNSLHIVNDILNGNLYAKNIISRVEDKITKGAKFFIELPLS